MDKIDNIGLTRILTQSYDFDGFTPQEVWSRIAQRMNIIIEHFNYLDKKFDNQKELVETKINYLLNEGLSEQVAKKILDFINDGTLGTLINDSLLKDINTKVDNFKTEVNEQLNNIIAYYHSGLLSDFINNSTSNQIVINNDIDEEIIDINKSNIEIIINSTVNTTAFNVNGDNVIITFLEKGNIKGKLKSSKTTRIIPNETNVLYFDNGHNFVIGDLIATSYGLGGDGKNHATVISVTDTTVTVDKNTISEIPVGVDIGTFNWGSLLNFNGKNSKCNNINVHNSNGYLISSNLDTEINGGTIENGGLDIALLKNGSVTFNNVYFGKVIDCAKTGFVLQGVTIILNDCIIDKNNSDADFVIYDSDLKTNIHANRCKFLSNNNHVSPYDYNKFALISIQSQRNGIVSDNIVFDSCHFESSIHGIFHKENDSFNPILTNVEFNNCNIKDGVGEIRYFTMYKCNFNTCDFNDIKNTEKEFILNNTNDVNINNSRFSYIKCRFSLVFNVYNCEFIDTSISVSDKYKYENIYIKNTSVNVVNFYEYNKVMSINNLIIDDTSLQNMNYNGDVGNIISLNADNSILKFRYPNSNNEYYLLRHVNRTFYISKMFTSFNKLPIFTKYDYILSNDSMFYDVTSNTYKKVSNVNLFEILNIVGNKVYGNTSRINVNDYINILKHNEGVVSIKITAVDEGYLTLESEVQTDNYYSSSCCYTLT